MKKIKIILCTLVSWLILEVPVYASVNLSISEANGPEGLSSTLQILIFLTFLTFLPAIVLTMTPFTRITIVLSMLRNGLGTQTTPSNQVLIGLAMFLTFFIMGPIVSEIKDTAIDPYVDGQISEDEFLYNAKVPMQSFMLKHTRAKDLEFFMSIADIEEVEDMNKLPFTVVVPSFILSELKIALEVAFLLFLPFVAIDFITSSILMSVGMLMLPPTMIALPFKILTFILVDGWHLVVKTLVESFM